MATSAVKTLVTTGTSSGLGFELMRQIAGQAQPWSITMGVRNVAGTDEALEPIKPTDPRTSFSTLPLDLESLKSVKAFAHATLRALGSTRLDYLLLNAAQFANRDLPGSGWKSAYVVNHLSQHYLVHLLREKLVESRTRVIFVSSGAVRSVSDPNKLDEGVRAGSENDSRSLYGQTKFIQLLGAHWWRRHLAGQCTVVAVSPGLIPGTGLTRGTEYVFSMDMPDAKPVDVGAQSMYAAFVRDDLPDDPEQIFLTSWGEWWSKDVYQPSLDKALQDKWCPSREEIEREEGLAS